MIKPKVQIKECFIYGERMFGHLVSAHPILGEDVDIISGVIVLINNQFVETENTVYEVMSLAETNAEMESCMREHLKFGYMGLKATLIHSQVK